MSPSIPCIFCWNTIDNSEIWCSQQTNSTWVCTHIHTQADAHTATRSNMQQHVATRCNTLQHTDSTHTSTFQTLTHSGLGEHMHALQCTHTLQHTEPHCITLQHTHAHTPQDVRRCPVQIWANTHTLCNTPQNTAAHTATCALQI